MKIISENTGVSLVVVGFVVGAIWWAAALQTKVDLLLQSSQQNITVNAALTKELAEHETRLRLLEQTLKKPTP